MKGAPWNRMIPGLRTPKNKILGRVIAGRVEAVGKNVKQFQPDDEVFGVTGFEGNGFAEYVCALEEKLAPKPVNFSFEGAVAVPIAASAALQGLRKKGQIQPGPPQRSPRVGANPFGGQRTSTPFTASARY